MDGFPCSEVWSGAAVDIDESGDVLSIEAAVGDHLLQALAEVGLEERAERRLQRWRRA